jgi:hypothetical protein
MDKSFIFAHSKETILGDNGKLGILPNPQYVLVGDGNADGLDNVIVARDLKDNVEKYSNACAYSGWIALVKNNYIDNDDFVYLFEYDTIISPSILDIRDEVVGYFALPSTAHMFLEWEPELYKQVNRVVKIVDYFHIGYAPMTSNMAMKGKWLKILAMELERAIGILGDHPYLGHILERIVVFTIWQYGIPYRLYLGAVQHEMACSHGQLKGYT